MNTVQLFIGDYKTRFYACLLGLALAQPSRAQTVNSTLNSYVALALSQNLALRREDLAVASAGQQLRQAGSLYQPQVQLAASYTLARGGRTIDFPVGDLLNPAYRALDGLTSGGFPTLANLSVQLLPNNFQETKLRVIQPLFNTDVYFNQQARRELLAGQQARQAAARNALRHQVEVAYYQYLQAGSAVAAYQAGARTLAELLRVTQARLGEGVATPDAVYDAKARLAGNQRDLLAAANRRQQARTSFNYLLNRPLDDSVRVEEPTGSTLPDTLATSLPVLRAAALRQRPELTQLARAEAASTVGVRQRQAARRYPQLSWVTDLGYQGFGYHPEVAQQRFGLTQLALSWDVYRGGSKRADEQLARLALDDVQAQRADLAQQLALQVAQATDNLATARAACAAARAAQLNAEKSYQLVRCRYVEGQAIGLELLDASTRQTAAQLAGAVAGYDVYIRETELRQALAID